LKKIGEFWVPDVDVNVWSRLGKTRRKTIARFTEGGPKAQDLVEVLKLLPSGRVAIDGGANVGAYARMLAAQYETVYAFEPAEDTFEALQQNIEEWGLSDRVITRNQALSDAVENVGMSLKLGGRSVSRTVSGPGDIPAVTIDSLELEQVDFIKLDVEGYEYQALAGARETLQRCHPAVLFEDKPGKRDLADTNRDPHFLLRSQGAHQVGCFGQGEFDYLYDFGEAASS
jgi:FkbM family methyltransferase